MCEVTASNTPRRQYWICTGESGGCGVTRRHARWGRGGEGRTGGRQLLGSCSGRAHLVAGGLGDVVHRDLVPVTR